MTQQLKIYKMNKQNRQLKMNSIQLIQLGSICSSRLFTIIIVTQMTQMKFFDDLDYDFACPPFVTIGSDDNFLSTFFYPRQQQPDQIYLIPTLPAKYSEVTMEISQYVDHDSNVKKCIKNTNSMSKASLQKSPSQKKDYKKNICGYITKKIVRQYISPSYKQTVVKLCQKHSCSYQKSIEFYDRLIQNITGPTHLDMLLNINKGNISIKKCFKQFFRYFLRHRYLRHLIQQGKMDRKDIYVDYKNNTLLYLASLDQKVKHEMDHQIDSKQYNSFQTHS